MLWNICLTISVAIFILFLCFIIIAKARVNKTKKHIKALRWLAVAVFICATVAFVPIYNIVFSDDGVFKTVLLSLHNAIRLFVVDADYTFILENLNGISSALRPFYTAYMALLFVLAPFFTASVVLSFFKNISATCKYKVTFAKEVYVFSELNEKSLTFAKSLKNNNYKRMIVFCDVFETNEEKSYELVNHAKDLGAICFNKDIVSVNFYSRLLKKEYHFFTIGEDASENIEQALKLGERYKMLANSHLYMFSKDVSSELALSVISTGKMKVRRINEAQALINKELYNNPSKIFSNYIEDEKGNKNISAIVIGMGEYGIEMVKTLIWFCQMDGYKFKLNAFDQNPSAEDEFALMCPEILDPEYNKKERDGDAYYDVTIHSGVNVKTKKFIDEIEKINDATYVFVSLGSDENNVNTAVELRRAFEKMGIKPIIQTVVYNSNLAKSLKSVKNHKNQPYDIDFTGDLESVYSESVIIDSALETEALSRHIGSGKDRKEEEFWMYEYNYRSSVSSAMHFKVKVACKVPYMDKRIDQLTEEQKMAVAKSEHCRWNAYMRTQGYVHAKTTDESSRNDLGKMHHTLIEFDRLSPEDKQKDLNILMNNK